MEKLQIFENFSGDGSRTFLSPNDVLERCPVAFASKATHPTCSNNYVPLRTADVMDLVSTFGWFPVSARQTGKGPNPARSLHMVVFEHPDLGVLDGDSPIGVPRLILINSLDGFTKLQFYCGFFRFVCSNGLIISDGSFGSLKVRHARTSMTEVSELIRRVIDKMGPSIQSVSDMAKLELTDQQAMDFALEALALRLRFKLPPSDEPKQLSDYLMIGEDMLAPLHEADQGRKDLWYHMNNVQERMVKGRFCYLDRAKDKGRSLKRLSSIARGVEFNKQLFSLATDWSTGAKQAIITHEQ